MKINLARGDAEPGNVLNIRVTPWETNVYRVIRRGVELSMFHGGRGVFEAEVEKVQDGIATVAELRELRKR